MLSKTRLLPGYFGEVGHLGFTGTSSSTRDNRIHDYQDKEYWLAFHDQYEGTTRSVSAPAFVGNEAIEWTNNGRKQYNYCKHTKLQLLNLPYTIYFRRAGYESAELPNYTPSYLYYYWRMGTASIVGGALPTTHDDWVSDNLRAEAYHTMIPRFRGKVDIMLSLFELKDFRDVAKYLTKNLGSLWNAEKALTKAWKSFRRMTRKPTLSDPTLPGANLWLFKQLMLDPIVKDILAILNQLNVSAHEAQLQFAENGLDLNTSYFTKIKTVANAITPGTLNNYWHGTGTYEKSIFTAVMQYDYQYRIRNQLNAWLKYWGLSGSYETFWNFIPFSFVLDYVLTVGKSIRAMEHDPHVSMDVHQYSESIKTIRHAGIMTTGVTGIKFLVLDRQYVEQPDARVYPLCTITGSIYTRKPTEPYRGPALPRLKFPSGKQGLTMAALARVLCS